VGVNLICCWEEDGLVAIVGVVVVVVVGRDRRVEAVEVDVDVEEVMDIVALSNLLSISILSLYE